MANQEQVITVNVDLTGLDKTGAIASLLVDQSVFEVSMGLTGPQGPPGNLTTYFNVTAYGATGNGTTDDTVAIQNTINVASAQGGTVFFPPGTYKISAALVLKTGVTLQGSGNEATFITQSNNGADGIIGTDVSSVGIRDLLIQGTSTGANNGVNLTWSLAGNLPYLSFRDLWVRNFGGDGIKLRTPIVSYFEKVISQNNGGNGFNFIEGGTSCTFTSCWARGNKQAGYRFYTSIYINLSACAADNNGIGYLIDSAQSIGFFACGAESQLQNDATYNGYAWKVTNSSIVSLDACEVVDNRNVAIWITSTANAVAIRCNDNSPNISAVNFIKVDSGCLATIYELHNTTANSLALSTTTIINDGGGGVTVGTDLTLGNNRVIAFRNAANNASKTVLSVDASNNTVLRSATTGLYQQTSNGTNITRILDATSTFDVLSDLRLPNNNVLAFQNNAGNAFKPVLTVDTGDNTILKSATTGIYFQNAAGTNIARILDAASTLDMMSHKITSVTDPASAQDAATKNYVDTTAQPVNANLTGLAGLATTGIIARTGSGTFATRAITGTANQVTVTNGDGVAAAPTLSLPQNIDTGATVQFANIGLGTASPTSSLTLASTATGITAYNTVDQVTNYERLTASWVTNVFTIATSAGGTGTARDLKFATTSRTLLIHEAASASGIYQFASGSSTAGANGAVFDGTWGSSSGINAQVVINPTFTQTGTAGYTALLVNPTETTTGSGTKLLADFQVGNSSKLSIDNTGTLTRADAANMVFGTTTGTKIATATTQKIGFYNATPIVQPTGAVLTALSNLGLVGSPTLAAAALSDGTIGSGNIVLATSPTITTPTISTINAASSAHLVLNAGTSKLVKTTVLRQDDTTNTYEVGNSVMLTGWGVMQGASNQLTETITFGVTFLQRPIVVAVWGGDSLGNTLTYGSGGNNAKGLATCKAEVITTTGFDIRIRTTDGTSWAATDAVFYQWFAIGEIA